MLNLVQHLIYGEGHSLTLDGKIEVKDFNAMES